MVLVISTYKTRYFRVGHFWQIHWIHPKCILKWKIRRSMIPGLKSCWSNLHQLNLKIPPKTHLSNCLPKMAHSTSNSITRWFNSWTPTQSSRRSPVQPGFAIITWNNPKKIGETLHHQGTCYLSIFRGPIFPCNGWSLWWTLSTSKPVSPSGKLLGTNTSKTWVPLRKRPLHGSVSSSAFLANTWRNDTSDIYEGAWDSQGLSCMSYLQPHFQIYSIIHFACVCGGLMFWNQQVPPPQTKAQKHGDQTAKPEMNIFWKLTFSSKVGFLFYFHNAYLEDGPPLSK